MGYFSQLLIDDDDREYSECNETVRVENVTRKYEKKPEPAKFTYIFRTLCNGGKMYYGKNGPTFNVCNAKKFILTEVEAIVKERSMGRSYKWKAVKV